MKYKLLAVSKFPNISGVNIGDYVQALASSQFLPHIDGFIDRDEDLKDYAGEPCKVIMNGWYMHLPQNWPPSDLIDPLFVAFHLNSGVKEVLLSSQSIAYLKPLARNIIPRRKRIRHISWTLSSMVHLILMQFCKLSVQPLSILSIC